IAQPTGSGEYVRRRVVARIVNRHCPTGGRVVDMGGGVGNLYVALRRDLRHRYTVVDVERAGYGVRIVGDVTAAPLAGGSADFVCLSDVLEHLVHDTDAVQEAVRAGRPGAHVVLHVPSTRTKPYAFLQRAADGAEAVDHQQFPHVRDGYTEDTLRSMLGEVAGASIVTLEPSFAPSQSLLSDLDAYLWWHKWTPLRVVPWLGIRLASRRAVRPVPAESSSGYVALLRKSLA
ncbi:MAG TPA: methyltransferase domain-containing protein, partial [Acidimicrobiales bacterium]